MEAPPDAFLDDEGLTVKVTISVTALLLSHVLACEHDFDPQLIKIGDDCRAVCDMISVHDRTELDGLRRGAIAKGDTIVSGESVKVYVPASTLDNFTRRMPLSANASMAVDVRLLTS